MDYLHQGLRKLDRAFYRASSHEKPQELITASCASYPSAPSVAPHVADFHTLPNSTPFVDDSIGGSDKQSNQDASATPVPPPNTPTASDSNSGKLSGQGETPPPFQPIYSPRITNFTRGNQSIHDGTTESARPTHVGYIHTAVDAGLVFEACLSGRAPQATRRLTQDERPTLIRSGSIFIYEEGTIKGTMNRWIDGLDWSCSRHMGNFVVYGALEAPDEQKRRRRPRFFRENQETAPAPAPAPAEVGDSTRLINDELCGPLIDSFGFPTSGLVKKTLTIKTDDKSYHLVSYFRPDDVRSEKLIRPTVDPKFRGIKPRYSVLSDLLSEPKSPDPNGTWVCLNEHHQGQDCGAGSAVTRCKNPFQRRRSPPTVNNTISRPIRIVPRPRLCKKSPPKAQTARPRPHQQSLLKAQTTKRKERRPRKPKQSPPKLPIEYVFVDDISPDASQQPQSPPAVKTTEPGQKRQRSLPKIPIEYVFFDDIDPGNASQPPQSPPKVDSTNPVTPYQSPYGPPPVENTNPEKTYQSPYGPQPVDNTNPGNTYQSPYGPPPVDNTKPGGQHGQQQNLPPADNTNNTSPGPGHQQAEELPMANNTSPEPGHQQVEGLPMANNTSPGYGYPQLQDLPIATGAVWYHGPSDQGIPDHELPTLTMANTFPYPSFQPFDTFPLSASYTPVSLNDNNAQVSLNDGNTPVFLNDGTHSYAPPHTQPPPGPLPNHTGGEGYCNSSYTYNSPTDPFPDLLPFPMDPRYWICHEQPGWLPGREHLFDFDGGYCTVGGF